MSSKIEVTYIDHMGTDLTVVNSARVSFGKRIKKLTERDIKLIKYLADHQHMTPFEHCSLTVLIKCPLYIRSQIHRHRTFSFNEVSRRYTDENIEFFQPEYYRQQHEKSKQCSAENSPAEVQAAAMVIAQKIEAEAIRSYNKLIELGVARELARGILPQSLMTEFYMTGNLRNWVHFLNLRLDAHAQQEVREIAVKIRDILLEKFPESTKVLLGQ